MYSYANIITLSAVEDCEVDFVSGVHVATARVCSSIEMCRTQSQTSGESSVAIALATYCRQRDVKASAINSSHKSIQ